MDMRLPKRPLGRTGLEVSVLGLGGFHQVEATQDTIDQVVGRYLDAGGNYVETARGYGSGASEEKLGRALSGRRDRVVLASKSGAKNREGAWRQINESLEALRTSYIDLYFFHGVTNSDDLAARCSSDGALQAYVRARDEGLIRHLAFSSHWPMMYVEGAEQLPIEAVLIIQNYLDDCDYPETPRVVVPAMRAKGIAVLLMKPIGVSTQFVILDGIIGKIFNPELAQADPAAKSGYASSNAYLNKSGGKYAKSVAKPLNYGFVFVICMAFGGLLSARTKGPTAQAIPEAWRSRFGERKTTRWLAVFAGGALVLFGARLAGGCTSGHMMSGMMQTSVSGYLFAMGAFIAAIPVTLIVYGRK